VRLKGSSLAVATLGFSIIVHLVILNEDWLTGGSIGMLDIPKPSLFGLDVGSEFAFYYVCLAVASIVYLGLDRLATSRFGRALTAMSQDEAAARASGIAVNAYKSKCFLVAAFTAGIAGGLYAYHTRYLSPNDFTFQRSIDILIMVVVGGLGSLPGAALGAAIVVLMPELLRSSGESRLILFGLLVVVLAGLGNRGLAGLIAALAQRIGALRRPAAAMRAQEP
jgi:branched-chain amino acid transport system permease protein